MRTTRRCIRASLYASLTLFSLTASHAQLAEQARRVGQFYAKKDGFSGAVVLYRMAKSSATKAMASRMSSGTFPSPRPLASPSVPRPSSSPQPPFFFSRSKASFTRPTSSCSTIPKHPLRGRTSPSASSCSTPPASPMAYASTAQKAIARAKAHRSRSHAVAVQPLGLPVWNSHRVQQHGLHVARPRDRERKWTNLRRVPAEALLHSAQHAGHRSGALPRRSSPTRPSATSPALPSKRPTRSPTPVFFPREASTRRVRILRSGSSRCMAAAS